MRIGTFCSATIRPLCYSALLVATTALAQDNQAVELQGTTIIGDRELPIGLYISPWRSSTPESELDKPSRYLDVSTEPLDPEVFERQVEYLEALDAAARGQ